MIVIVLMDMVIVVVVVIVIMIMVVIMIIVIVIMIIIIPVIMRSVRITASELKKLDIESRENREKRNGSTLRMQTTATNARDLSE